MHNNVSDKGINSCCSCSGCSSICPNSAIDMVMNKKGFYEPVIDENKCVDCGLCMTVCYKYEHEFEDGVNITDTDIFAMWSNTVETRYNASSGGVISEIIKWGIQNQYNIIGCQYNSDINQAEHIVINTIENIKYIQGSKYLLSNISGVIRNLDLSEKYIVIATPCQIYSIKKYLEFKKCENNFIFIDFFCHGVPSYNLWNKYIQYLNDKGIKKIEKINFRLKEESWHKYSIFIEDIYGKIYNCPKDKDPFMLGFLNNVCLNESCYECKYRFNKLYSDIRVGDFWGEEYKNNKDGVCIVLINSEVGKEIINNIRDNVVIKRSDFSSLKDSQGNNPKILKNKNSYKYDSELCGNKGIKEINKMLKTPLYQKVINKMRKRK